MLQYFVILCCVLSNIILLTEQLEVFPKAATVAEGEGLILQVSPLGPLESCVARFGGYSLPLSAGVFNETLSVGYQGNGLQAGECGAFIRTFNSTTHGGTWLFQLTDTNGTPYTVKAIITASEVGDLISYGPTMAAALGEELTIPCGDANANSNTFSCKLINPQGNLFQSGTNNCTLQITNLRMEDVGTWKCVEELSFVIQEKITYTNVTVHSVESLQIGHLENDKYFSMYCNTLPPQTSKNALGRMAHKHKSLNRALDEGGYVEHCGFQRPDGKYFNMADGRLIDRYSYYGKGLNAGECGLSISKPLLDEDMGTWTCSVALQDFNPTGGFITTSSDKSDNGSSNIRMKNEQTLSVLSGSSLTMDCSVNVALSYCWFKHPNGTRYHVHPDSKSTSYEYHGNSLLLGQCGITLFSTNESDSGAWNCGMGIHTEAGAATDLQQVINVRVSDTPFIVNQTVTTAMSGDRAILGCHSLQGEALHYCSFMAPNGTGYNMSPGQAKGRLTYYGAGLQYGDCAVLVNPVMSIDYGTWQCMAKLVSKNDVHEYALDLELQSPSFLSSSTVGLLIGVVLAVAAVIATLVYTQYRRRRRSRGNTQSRPIAFSGLSELSDDVIVDVATPPAAASAERSAINPPLVSC